MWRSREDDQRIMSVGIKHEALGMEEGRKRETHTHTNIAAPVQEEKQKDGVRFLHSICQRGVGWPLQT